VWRDWASSFAHHGEEGACVGFGKPVALHDTAHKERGAVRRHRTHLQYDPHIE
jgi:hypothetical protein